MKALSTLAAPGVAILAFLMAGNAPAAMIHNLANDAAWVSDFEAQGWTKTFGVQSREGVLGAGDFETAIIAADFTTYAQGQADWTNAATHTFSFAMDGAGLVTHDTSLTSPINASPTGGATVANTIAIRAKALAQSGEVTVASTLRDLSLQLGLTAFDLMGNTTLVGDADAAYLVITGLDLSGGFLLSGSANFDVGSSQGGRSRVIYEIKVGTFPDGGGSVPVPATIALLGLGLAAVGWRRRRDSRR